MTKAILFTLIRKLIFAIMVNVSDDIKELLKINLRNIYSRAKETENPFDDYLIEIIADILCINLNEERKI